MLSLTVMQSWILILMCTLMLFAIVIVLILFVELGFTIYRNIKGK